MCRWSDLLGCLLHGIGDEGAELGSHVKQAHVRLLQPQQRDRQRRLARNQHWDVHLHHHAMEAALSSMS